MARVSASPPALPDCKGQIPFFAEEDNWTPRQHELFERLNRTMEETPRLAECCAQYLAMVSHREAHQMLLVQSGMKFKSALEEAGFSENDVRSVMLYARRHNGNGGKHTGWGPSAA